jgi:uncharacterized OB-fold protein
MDSGRTELVDEQPLARPLPVITDMNSYFWCGGKDGRLLILRCSACGTYAHPYVGRCAICNAKAMAPEPVSGYATVIGFTINYQPWFPHVPVPYIVAIVTIEEQADIYLVTNIVKCPLDQASIGMKVKVLFEQHGEIFLPLFEPA